MNNIERYPDCKSAREAFDLFKADGGTIDFYEWLNLPYVEPQKPTTARVLAKALVYISGLPKDGNVIKKRLLDWLAEAFRNEEMRGRMNFMKYDNAEDASYAFNEACAKVNCKNCVFCKECGKTFRSAGMARWLYSDIKDFNK